MGVIAAALIFLAYLLMIVGWVWILILAFQDEVLWGVLCFFIPLVGIYIVIKTWPESKVPLFIYLGGIGLVVVGALVGSLAGDGPG